MKNNRLKKIIRAGAAVLMAGVLSGCSVKFGTRKEPKLDTVIAHPTNGAEGMNVTYEMFRMEYKYYLDFSEIDDDTLEAVAAQCASQRKSIVESLVNEQIMLRKAREMGVYDLTEEERKAVDEEFAERIADHVAFYGNLAAYEQAGEDGEPTMTDEEKEAIGNQRLDEMLEKCGMTRDTFRWWVESSKIMEKLEKAVGDTVPYSKAEEEFKGVQEYAEELYNTSMTSYSMGGYSQIWLPEGSRLIKHILIGFDSDTLSSIKTLRGEGSDGEADKLRAEEAEKLKEKQEEIEAKLDEGADIEELIAEYSADAVGSTANPDGYTVIPNGETFVKEFQEAAFVPEKIGDRTTCVTDYGVHIMIYVGNAKVSDSAVKSYTEYLYEELKSKEFSDKMLEWAEEYAFEIDYETLRLEAPEES